MISYLIAAGAICRESTASLAMCHTHSTLSFGPHHYKIVIGVACDADGIVGALVAIAQILAT